MMEEVEKKLQHASSRKVMLKDSTVVKFYPRFYGYVIHEIVRMLFFMVYGASDRLASPKKRILNEIAGRKILKSLGLKTTEIKKISLKNKYIEERFETNAYTIDDLEKTKLGITAKLASKIGKITRKVNDKGYYFIDNRASNWMFSKSLIRTDLELFDSHDKNNDFFMFCDVLSFVSSVRNEKIKQEFMKGYGKRIYFNFFGLLQFAVRFYIKTTDWVL